MNWVLGLLAWLTGALVTAYLLGRFTSPDRMNWTSELRALAPAFVVIWPVAWGGMVIVGFIYFAVLFTKLSTAFFTVPYNMGNARRIEWESKTKLLGSHEIAAIEKNIKELEEQAKRILDHRE